MKQQIVGALVTIWLVAGCSATSATTQDVPAAKATPTAGKAVTGHGRPVAGASSSASAAAYPAVAAVEGFATDDQGDRAFVSVALGAPEPLSGLGSSDIQPCDNIENLYDDAGRAMAIPVVVSVELGSSMSSSLTVDMDGTNDVGPGGTTPVNGNLPVWGTAPDTDGTCASSTGDVTWSNIQPGQMHSWAGYLVDPEAITPDDPNGSSANLTILLMPNVGFDVGNGDFEPNLKLSHNLVKCEAGVPFGAVIAVSPKVAFANGCTKYVGG